MPMVRRRRRPTRLGFSSWETNRGGVGRRKKLDGASKKGTDTQGRRCRRDFSRFPSPPPAPQPASRSHPRTTRARSGLVGRDDAEEDGVFRSDAAGRRSSPASRPSPAGTPPTTRPRTPDRACAHRSPPSRGRRTSRGRRLSNQNPPREAKRRRPRRHLPQRRQGLPDARLRPESQTAGGRRGFLVSGLGGLCCASILARYGLDVVALGSHDRPHRTAHSFDWPCRLQDQRSNP